MTPHPPARGRTDRIALIHAVYALVWAGLAAQDGLPVSVVAAAVVLAGALVLLTWRALDPAAGMRPDDGVGRWIVRINLLTAFAAVAVIVAAHVAARDELIVPGVLGVMGVHFVPLWRILRRVSLLWMGIALLGCAAIAVVGHPPSIAALVSALVFGANSLRLYVAGRR